MRTFTRPKQSPKTILPIVLAIVPAFMAASAPSVLEAQDTVCQTSGATVASLTLREVREQLPTKPLQQWVTSGHREPRLEQLFRRLGALRGERAVGEIIRRYGKHRKSEYFAVYAMGQVLAGWMSADPHKATTGLLELARGTEYLIEEQSRTIVRWKGIAIILDGDFSNVFVWNTVLGEVLRAAAKSDPELGMALLRRRELLGSRVYVLVNDYTSALGKETDWMAVRRQLDQLLNERGRPDFSPPWDPVPSAVARGWARWDLDSAIAWYLDQTADSGRGTHRALGVLRSADREQAINWLKKNKETGLATDELMKDFADRLNSVEDLRQIIALTEDPSVREKILSRAVTPRRHKQEQRMIARPDALYDLIKAANLSPAKEAHLRSVVKKNEHFPVVNQPSSEAPEHGRGE